MFICVLIESFGITSHLTFNEFLDENLNIEKVELRPLQNTISLFIKMFTYLLLVDIFFCAFYQDYQHLISSVILLGGIGISKMFFKYDKYDFGICFLAMVFYVIGFYHVLTIGNYNTCYFILMVIPIMASLLLEKYYVKIFLIGTSSLLFLMCNYFSGLPLFENYFFFYGLIPASFLMIHFHDRLEKLTLEKSNLIKELKEKNEEVLLFSNMMSHDLKAPLRSIDGFSQLLLKKMTGLNPEESQMFSFIIQGVNSLKKLIDDLLEYSRFSSLNKYVFKEIDLDDLINKLLVNLNYDISKNKVTVVKSGLTKIYGHEESIFLVFQNLLSNAIKYQPKDATHQPYIQISQLKKGNKNIIHVKDNGIGIDEKKFEEVFMPFKRFHNSSEYEGTGLGMSIVNKVIEKHSGEIKVESELGKGSTFVISLPEEL